MSEKQGIQVLKQVNHIGFASLVGIGAAVGMSARTGNIGIGIAIGVAVFLIFGLELS